MPDLRGMDSYEIRVLHFLEQRSSSSSLLGISGMRGVGKSTLLRLTYTTTYLRRYHPFEYIFFLELGDSCTVGTLQNALAWEIGLDDRLLSQVSNTDDALSATKIISSRLKDEPFLLLLDDVRDRIDLEAIGLPMPLGHNQKVVFTTRDQAVCAEMGGDTFQMQCLGQDDAWDLFRYHVGDKIISSDSEIEYLAKQMVAECRGIPSALCTVALSMSNQSDCVLWRVAYELLTIKPPPTNDIQDKSDEGYPHLKHFEDLFS